MSAFFYTVYILLYGGSHPKKIKMIFCKKGIQRNLVKSTRKDLSWNAFFNQSKMKAQAASESLLYTIHVKNSFSSFELQALQVIDLLSLANKTVSAIRNFHITCSPTIPDKIFGKK